MRGRPRLDVGTYGAIRTQPVRDRWKAFAQYRGLDGRTRQYSRTGDSKAAAVRRLRVSLASQPASAGEGSVTPTTWVSDLAGAYFAQLATLVEAGDRSPNTLRLYRGYWDAHLEPAIGGLAVGEVGVQRLDQLLTELRSRQGAETVRTFRAVLSGVFGMAARYGAIRTNPVRDVGPIPGDTRDPPRALTPTEAVDLWRKLTELARTVPEKAENNRRYRQVGCDPDLPDLVLWMLGTGDRVGNALAVHWPWIDLDTATAQLGPNVIRVKGEGLKLNKGTIKSREACWTCRSRWWRCCCCVRASRGTHLGGRCSPTGLAGLEIPATPPPRSVLRWTRSAIPG